MPTVERNGRPIAPCESLPYSSSLVLHNSFFESFHLTLKLNKANGIAESAMFLSLDDFDHFYLGRTTTRDCTLSERRFHDIRKVFYLALVDPSRL
jgi:hypothetical protein